MSADVDLAAIGALLADGTRASFLIELLGGEPLPAGELARRAGVSPSRANNHLRRLRDAGFVEVHVFGRERHYRLGSFEIAHALEALGRLAPATQARTLRSVEKRRALERARTCYDHLAGRLGVSLTDRLLDQQVIEARDGSYIVTRTGKRWLHTHLGIATETIETQQRRFAYACDDLSERRPHLAGALGAALADSFLGLGYVQRARGSRALKITSRGSSYLAGLGIDIGLPTS